MVYLPAAQTIPPICTHFSVAWSVCLCVCLSVVCHTRAPCLNRSTDLNAIWQVHLWGPMTHRFRWGSSSDSPVEGRFTLVVVYVDQPTLYESIVPAEFISATSRHARPASSGVQLYEQQQQQRQVNSEESLLLVDAVGRPLPHVSAQKHATGEAQFVDDLPFYRGQL